MRVQEDRIPALLDRMREVGGFLCTLLASASSQARPEPPLLSTQGWNTERIQEQLDITKLAVHLATVKDYQNYAPTEGIPEAIRQLRDVVERREPYGFVVIPLRKSLSETSADIPAFQKAVVLAYGIDQHPTDEHKGQLLDLCQDLVEKLQILQFDDVLARSKEVAQKINESVFPQLDQPTQLNWMDLVATIRGLLKCDTCQLYLKPEFAPELVGNDAERIWLVAESVAEREGLWYGWSDPNLTSYLWRNDYKSPLNIPNLHMDKDYRRIARGRFGHARHFLGMVLKSSKDQSTLGIIKLYDKLQGAGEDTKISEDGFSDSDVNRLSERAVSVVSFVEGKVKALDTDNMKWTIKEKHLKRLRNELTAESCLLFLTPRTLGKPTGEDDTVLLYCAVRHDWLQIANYKPGEGRTGKVYETGKFINEPNVLAPHRMEQRIPKYRFSEHFLGVPVKLPAALAGNGPGETIGVLKVRDRLTDNNRLSAQAFSAEDRDLLQAFANLVGTKLAFHRLLRDREASQAKPRFVVGERVYHDVANVLYATMNLVRDKIPDGLAKDLDRGVGFLARSLDAAFVKTGDYPVKAPAADTCDMVEVLNRLLPKRTDFSPLAMQTRFEMHQPQASITLAKLNSPLPRIVCKEGLLEIAVLMVPVWLSSQTAPKEDKSVLDVAVSTELLDCDERVRLRFVPLQPITHTVSTVDSQICVYYPNHLVGTLTDMDDLEKAFRPYDARIQFEPSNGTSRLEALNIDFRVAKAPL